MGLGVWLLLGSIGAAVLLYVLLTTPSDKDWPPGGWG